MQVGKRTGSILEPSRRSPELPLWRPVEQHFPRRALSSVEDEVRSELARSEIEATIRPGMRVAVAVGSRGIANLDRIVRTLVEGLRQRGAEPFIVPAMGSHGGGTAEGQAEVLAGYGVDEEHLGVPVRASMETVELGTTENGISVYTDRTAHEQADAVIPVARVKPHTDFRAPVESGLHKMMTIGLGKHRGASMVHTYPLSQFGEVITEVGQFILAQGRIPFGLVAVEDGNEDTALIEAVPAGRMLERERELLALAKEWFPRLPFASADVLIVQQLGKNISGSGMDPNVTGRFPQNSVPSHVELAHLIVLDLTDETHGNACGMGFADITTRRLAEKVDAVKTYTNHVTAQLLDGASLPLVAETDLEALQVAVNTLRRTPSERARIAWIENTLRVGHLWMSEPLWDEVKGSEALRAVGDPQPITFDEEGNLLLGD